MNCFARSPYGVCVLSYLGLDSEFALSRGPVVNRVNWSTFSPSDVGNFVKIAQTRLWLWTSFIFFFTCSFVVSQMNCSAFSPSGVSSLNWLGLDPEFTFSRTSVVNWVNWSINTPSGIDTFDSLGLDSVYLGVCNALLRLFGQCWSNWVVKCWPLGAVWFILALIMCISCSGCTNGCCLRLEGQLVIDLNRRWVLLIR